MHVYVACIWRRQNPPKNTLSTVSTPPPKPVCRCFYSNCVGNPETVQFIEVYSLSRSHYYKLMCVTVSVQMQTAYVFF